MFTTVEELKKIISQGESRTLEFKKSTAQLSDGCKSLCGFLNGEGGTLIFGVSDNHKIIGQKVNDKTKLDLDSRLTHIQPKPRLDISYFPVPATDNQIIIINAKDDLQKKPYLYDGRAYIRCEAGKRQMTAEELRYAILNNADNWGKWDARVCQDATLDDIDVNELLGTIREGVGNGRLPEDAATVDPWEALQHLDLVKDNQLINAAVVLFGKKISRFFPQCNLRLARFKGINKDEFIDSKYIDGNAFELLRSALRFANQHLPVASTFPSNSFERHDEPLFPIIALREAIANAICHRNYTEIGGSISMAIYDDRIEIWSYGLLAPGVDVNKLCELNQSIPRNRHVASALYYHKYFEKWGRGVNLITNSCVNAGHPAPYYQINTAGVLLTLPSKQLIGGGHIVTQPQCTLTERQQAIMALLNSSNGLSTSEIHQQLDDPPSERTIREDLDILHKAGKLILQGKTRGRRWYLIKSE
ncbi:MAG: ATP-dependent DNA helicase RecG [Legionellales bacterium]|nr:ATP-dependent DNA helicase RecG [Legionellales bacterium]|tara:strand:- start:4401 stop:5822 length:1422 start_codon:yes stop_codon:yes gene_type:complete